MQLLPSLRLRCGPPCGCRSPKCRSRGMRCRPVAVRTHSVRVSVPRDEFVALAWPLTLCVLLTASRCRQFVTELNLLTVALSGTCTAATCKTMNATDEWQYLCAAHKTPSEVLLRLCVRLSPPFCHMPNCLLRIPCSQCCAIDYMVHTLDGTSALLCADKSFPSR